MLIIQYGHVRLEQLVYESSEGLNFRGQPSGEEEQVAATANSPGKGSEIP